jgi:hypothetical protein
VQVIGTSATRLTLRTARGQGAQQNAIDAWARGLPVGNVRAAVIAEGAFFELAAPPGVPVERLVSGCVCCVGLVPLRVTLTRLLRMQRPTHVLLLIADATHVDRVRALATDGRLGVTVEMDE